MVKRLALLLFPLITACGVVSYPGQPGVVTNGYAKVDMELLEQPGLFVYEVVYDNGPGGQGVGAIVTKLYPGARTYTSNVRTNADGTVYRAKAQYQGAKVEMIAIPALNQIYVAPDSQVQFLIGYETSLDEVDDRNLSEEGIFSGGLQAKAQGRWHRARQLVDAIRAGTLTKRGRLAYNVVKAEMAGKIFTPSQPVSVETSLTQNAVLTDLSSSTKKEAADFLEANFPKGYRGKVHFHLSNGTKLTFSVDAHTFKTAVASGKKVIHNLTPGTAARLLKKYAQN